MAEHDFIGAEQGTVITVGTFDGVHRGHRDLLERLVARADQTGLAPLLVSFEPHPLAVVRPEAAPLLLTPGIERLEALVMTAIDHVALLPFTRALAAHSPEQFVRVLRERFVMRELLIGYDHGFGRGRSGDVETLKLLGQCYGFPVDVVPAVTDDDGKPLSSSAIRAAIDAADLDRAAGALGRRYAFFGRVVPGAQRGRVLGYPTLNLELPDPRKLLPPFGVYAVVADTGRGRFGGMMNLGARPTFDDPGRSLEVHLFEASGDFYGALVRVEFVSRLRDVRRFESVDALVAQLGRDEAAARAALTQIGEPPKFMGSILPTPSP